MDLLLTYQRCWKKKEKKNMFCFPIISHLCWIDFKFNASTFIWPMQSIQRNYFEYYEPKKSNKLFFFLVYFALKLGCGWHIFFNSISICFKMDWARGPYFSSLPYCFRVMLVSKINEMSTRFYLPFLEIFIQDNE